MKVCLRVVMEWVAMWAPKHGQETERTFVTLMVVPATEGQWA